MASADGKKAGNDLELQQGSQDVQTGVVSFEKGEIVTASGHVQELERNFVSFLGAEL